MTVHMDLGDLEGEGLLLGCEECGRSLIEFDAFSMEAF